METKPPTVMGTRILSDPAGTSCAGADIPPAKIKSAERATTHLLKTGMMNLPSFLRRTAKTRSSANGELSRGVVTQNVMGNAFSGQGQRRWLEGRVAELERQIGQQAVEIDFLKVCLQRIEEQRMPQASSGNPRSTGKSAKRRA
jgi:hypothetical protein